MLYAMKTKIHIIIFAVLILSQANIYSQNYSPFLKGKIYCDEHINSGLYQTVLVANLELGFYNNIITYDQLKDIIVQGDYSEILISMKSDVIIQLESISLVDRMIKYNGNNISFDDIREIKFKKPGSFFNSLLGIGGGFLIGSFVSLVYEAFDSLIGSDDIEWEQIFILGGIGAVIGAIKGIIWSEETVIFSSK